MAVAFVIQIPITAANECGVFDTPAARVANLFTFFTILTNLLVGGASAAIALRPAHRGRLLAVLRVDAVLGIAVTAAVHHTLLVDLHDLRGAEELADQLFHSVSPTLALAGWLLFGPRGLVDRRVVLASLAYPLVWLAYPLVWLVCTLVRGALIGWYPYPFVDVGVLGYPQVLLNCLGVTLLFLVLAGALLGLDRLLPGRRARDPAAGARIRP